MSGSQAARAFGGIFAVLWCLTGIVVCVALSRLRRLRRASSLIGAYALPKGAVLAFMVLWCAVEVFVDFWWAAPRAWAERSVLAAVLVDGLCRPTVFAGVLSYWRVPLSSFLLDRFKLMERAELVEGEEDPYMDGENSGAEGTEGDVQMAAVPPKPGTSRGVAGDARGTAHPRSVHAGPNDGGHAATSGSAITSPAAVDPNGDGGDFPAAGGGQYSPREATGESLSASRARGHQRCTSQTQLQSSGAVVPRQTVDQRLQMAVASKGRALPPAIVIAACFLIHVSMGIVQSRATSDAGGLRWCIAIPQTTFTEMCVVPLEGSSRQEVLRLSREIRENSGDMATTAPPQAGDSITVAPPGPAWTGANATTEEQGSSTTTTVAPAPTETEDPEEEVIDVVVDGGFEATPVMVVPARLISIVTFAIKALIAAAWLRESGRYKASLINENAIERFHVYRLVTSSLCVLTAVAEGVQVFEAVRATGWAFTFTMLVGSGADALLVSLIALRAAKLNFSTLCSVSSDSVAPPQHQRDDGDASQEGARPMGPLGRFALGAA